MTAARPAVAQGAPAQKAAVAAVTGLGRSADQARSASSTAARFEEVLLSTASAKGAAGQIETHSRDTEAESAARIEDTPGRRVSPDRPSQLIDRAAIAKADSEPHEAHGRDHHTRDATPAFSSATSATVDAGQPLAVSSIDVAALDVTPRERGSEAAATSQPASARSEDATDIVSLVGLGTSRAQEDRRSANNERTAKRERPLAEVLSATTTRSGDGAAQVQGDGGPTSVELRLTRWAATVSRVETHFAPVQAAVIAPAERKTESVRVETAGIFEQIQTAVSSDGEPGTTETRPTAAPPATTPQTPVRVLELALQPAALGSLTVTLRLTGTGGMKVTVSATESSTAVALENDADALATVVAAAGYTVEEVSITHAART